MIEEVEEDERQRKKKRQSGREKKNFDCVVHTCFNSPKPHLF